jgi:predicted CXXCH cytochrome family protein
MSHVTRIILTAAGAAAVAVAGALAAGQGEPAAGAAREKPTVETEQCATADCHQDIVNRKVMHRPTAQKQCLECHEYDDPAQHTFNLVVEADELCWECHDEPDKDVVHEPVDEGKCTECHDPHGSDYPAMLPKGLSDGFCFDCHDDLTFMDKKFVHGPVAAQACTACHHPHQSDYEHLLRNSPTKLCLGCHFADLAAEDKSVHRHEAIVKDGCARCHDPHASDFRYQLNAQPPQLCWECHDDVKASLDKAAVVHGPVVAAGGCGSCHDPHYSTFPSLLLEPQPRLCLTCHDKPVKATDGHTLANLSEVLKENPNRHGPVRDGKCAACHQPHASEYFRLLAESYPPKFYARYDPDQYELCFDCHDEDLADDESGTDVTNFRNGDRNLHWVHVNRPRGRTCRACHDVHAAKQSFLIRQSVPFGSAGWRLEINFEPAEDGGRCAPDCHKPQRYRRDGSGEQPAGPAEAPAAGQ